MCFLAFGVLTQNFSEADVAASSGDLLNYNQHPGHVNDVSSTLILPQN